jgi:hypothetical protein
MRMYVDDRTLDLFSPFDREVGNPHRRRIRTQEQFENFVQLNNGVSKDIFTSVYPSNHAIDKLFFDFDCSTKKYPDLTMGEVFDDFCRFYGYLVDLGEHPLPIITGKKGYHLYIPLISTKSTKQELWLATLSLLYEAGLIWFDYDENGIKQWHQSRAIDTTTIGDVEQLCRIPNTRRAPENIFWCTWLPLHKYDVRDMSVGETFTWAQRYHLRDDECVRVSRLKKFITRDSDFFSDFRSSHCGAAVIGGFGVLSEKEKMLHSMLSPFIPDSVISRVIHPEADQESRFITALSMLESGLSVDFVVNLLRLIEWNDWSVAITRYQVEQINNNRGLRYKYGGNYGAAILSGKKKE